MTIPEFKFTIRGNKKEMLRVANEAGDFAFSLYQQKGIDQTCSDILANGIIDIFSQIIEEIDRPFNEIITNKKHMFFWMNTRFVAEIGIEMMRNRVHIIPELLLDAEYAKKGNAVNFPHMIAGDLQTFCIYTLLHGATPDMPRKHVKSKDLKPVIKLDNMAGPKAFFSILTRAFISYIKFSEIVIKPILDEMLLGKCTTSINRLHVVHEGKPKETSNKTPIKTERKKNQVCSLQDLQSLVK